MESENVAFLPVALRIEGRKIVIIGGGHVGLHKATILSRFTRNVTVISPTFLEGFSALPFRLLKKEYASTDLADAFLVYICTEDKALNRRIHDEAAARGILTSVCDAPSLCDVISPAILRQDNICIAVTSDGRDVRRSIRIRDRIRRLVGEVKGLLE
jgi:siroheme synthase-like protein